MADQKEPVEIMLEKKVGELQRQNEIMRQLGTLDGFFTAVFNMVKHSRTNEEAFNAVNDQYFEIWGQYRFSDFESYRRSRYYHYKKK